MTEEECQRLVKECFKPQLFQRVRGENLEAKECKCCGKVFFRRRGETIQTWTKRKFCTKKCGTVFQQRSKRIVTDDNASMRDKLDAALDKADERILRTAKIYRAEDIYNSVVQRLGKDPTEEEEALIKNTIQKQLQALLSPPQPAMLESRYAKAIKAQRYKDSTPRGV